MKKWYTTIVGNCDVHRDIYEEGNPKPIAERIMFDAANALVAAHNGEQQQHPWIKGMSDDEVRQKFFGTTPTPQGQSRSETGATGSDEQDDDLERLRKEVAARGELSNAFHDVAMWCLDLTLTCMTTDGVSDGIRRRARAAHSIILKYRRQYDLRSRAEVERGQWDLAIDSPNYDAFAPSPAQEKQVEASVEELVEIANSLDWASWLESVSEKARREIREQTGRLRKIALATASPSEDTKRLLRQAQRYVSRCIGEGTPEESEAAYELSRTIDAAMSSPSVTQTKTSPAAPTQVAQERQSQETGAKQL